MLSKGEIVMEAQQVILEFSDGKTATAIIPVLWKTEEEAKGVTLSGIKIVYPRELGDDYTIENVSEAFNKEK